MKTFRLYSDFSPQGDQVQAIDQLTEGVLSGKKHQVLLGVTGSGKTFTMANLIARINRPVLVISPNKTLAAQLYQEFRRFFPENAVEYFVSYYDYYQPEAYIPATNTYIAKEATINEEIDRLRLAATNALYARRDVIIVASVSCIYGIGAPDTYYSQSFPLETGQNLTRKELLDRLVGIQYERSDDDLKRGTFRVRGDIIDVFPPYEDFTYRLEIENGQLREISIFDPLLGVKKQYLDRIVIYPRTFFSTPRSLLEQAIAGIEQELKKQVEFFTSQGKYIEAQRIEERTLFDLEMLREFGYCPGIENYSLYLSQRRPGQPPYTLLDYFPEDFLTIIDESHIAVPQIGGMYHGDRSRKLTLIEHGFRLPSALDNRPLNFREFEQRVGQVIYVSATPGPYEMKKAGGQVVEQIIRPTGLIDPEVEIRPVKGQIDDLMKEIKERARRNERTLVTTLTKKMAEDLTRYYHELGLKVRYLHSDIETLERVKILRDLRKGKFDALIGINLLREGLDLPEVSLVAILDADKEGFLRSTSSLIQTFGRASRNLAGRAILYADTVTDSMKKAIEETNRRRQIQRKYNEEHGITPQSIQKNIDEVLTSVYERDYVDYTGLAEEKDIYLSPEKRQKRMAELETLMKEAARNLEFEKAAKYRDELQRLKKRELELMS
ncbi:MAG TPA: excinuclease ABC subunit UvrB [Candidatus Saccharicenans sp.]|jgi:excinuclease ABC subunit B|nr:excinuclease ABC subunit UvrB [Candidatus Saccharicenans sp.]HOL45505.1 excinuclease ABC subunit UvrB [Candidatus Saccharicenans sp.]HOP60752.1 excinuclease ABC subunit UvrB [Candidatus Saccharicenans sp.]HPP23901.1 excinuclease ABC subunit UvrB [Candidatus Saccharicenans sp.]HPU94038.1 excinuclease ABC subunit UvrB [Candidatus Saccharicenans sp.]